MVPKFVDIRCHLLPGVDDGAGDSADALAMALIAVDQGVDSIVVTPRQRGAFASIGGDEIRVRTVELQELLDANGVPVRVYPGAELTFDSGLVDAIASGDAVTLADQGRHALVRPLSDWEGYHDAALDDLNLVGVTLILASPELTPGLPQRPSRLAELVERGCLIQINAESLLGAFGQPCQKLAEQLCRRGLVHFIATDAHGARSRPPRLADAYRRAVELAGPEAARSWCCVYPRFVMEGRAVPTGPIAIDRPARTSWFVMNRAA